VRGVNTIVLVEGNRYLYGRIIALRRDSGAPRYLVKPYSIALAVSIPEAAILIMVGHIYWGGGFMVGWRPENLIFVIIPRHLKQASCGIDKEYLRNQGDDRRKAG
jgi:hypothetical protein